MGEVCVCPIRERLVITSCFLFISVGISHFSILCLMFLSLFEKGKLVQYFCHSFLIMFWMVLSVSDDVIKFIFIADDEEVASFANVSTFSFPGIPMWEGTHMNDIDLFVSDISFCILCIISFLGEGWLLM